jgi:predicted ATPase
VAGALARVLAGQQLLLVLDNCEHVIEAAAQLCAGLLAACDDVRVLATSREPLAVAGEARYRLGPLTLPGPGDGADAAGCESVALFADRARRTDPRFTLDGQAGPVVARLVARLDGMPLAIELAAARVEALGVAQLLDRLDDRFALLTGGDRLAAGRQRSLAATAEWSYQLLEERERRVFRAVSVFPAGFTLDRGRGGGRGGRGASGAAAGGLLAADTAAARAGWPVPVRDAGDAARLRGRAAGRGRGGRRGRRRAGRVRAGSGRAGRGRGAVR